LGDKPVPRVLSASAGLSYRAEEYTDNKDHLFYIVLSILFAVMFILGFLIFTERDQTVGGVLMVVGWFGAIAAALYWFHTRGHNEE